MSRTLPKIIVIAGTTGVGKSQLSIQLANKFNGEVINSDSMQMYRDIPIITNKHPMEERMGVPHHVMNHVPWDEEYYIHRFEKECIDAVNDIISRGKLPIIVGGTHYYLQVLFDKKITAKPNSLTDEQRRILDSDEVYSKLSEIDPDIASKFHPNDSRRVRRLLEIFYETGQKPSVVYANQDSECRYDALFYWIYSEQGALDKRLDDRVDKMVETGALTEIEELYKVYTDSSDTGVWQVIGFKEFLPWLKDRTSDFSACVEQMKLRTRQYAKKQVKWIRKMLVPDVEKLYVLDATDLSVWDEKVSQRAESIASEFLENNQIVEPTAPQGLENLLQSPEKESDFKHYTCEICRDSNDEPLITIGAAKWDIHMKSRRHRSNVKRSHKRQKRSEHESEKSDEPKEIGADERS